MIIKKAAAIQGRIERVERILEQCKKLHCPLGNKIKHEIEMIQKAASEIIEEVGK